MITLHPVNRTKWRKMQRNYWTNYSLMEKLPTPLLPFLIYMKRTWTNGHNFKLRGHSFCLGLTLHLNVTSYTFYAAVLWYENKWNSLEGVIDTHRKKAPGLHCDGWWAVQEVTCDSLDPPTDPKRDKPLRKCMGGRTDAFPEFSAFISLHIQDIPKSIFRAGRKSHSVTIWYQNLIFAQHVSPPIFSINTMGYIIVSKQTAQV